MNKRQHIVQQHFLNNEKAITKRLYQVYSQSLKDVTGKAQKLYDEIEEMTSVYDDIEDEAEKAVLKSRIQSKVYQKQYQESLKKQIGEVLDKMNENQFTTVSDYLNKCYEEGFVGTLYDMQGQGIPLAFPIDQEAMVRAVQLDSKISKGLYNHLGENVNVLKKHITAQVSRGISSGMTFSQIAQQLSMKMVGTYTNPKGSYAYAKRIARTEGHRIQCQGTMDACYKAKDKGADVVKQWDSTLDAKTRDSHVAVDGQYVELDEKFSNGLMFPGDPSGRPEEVIHCRCALLQRARWAVKGGFTKMNNFTKQLETFDSPEDYAEFKKGFFSKENKQYMNYVQDMENKYKTKDFAKILDSMNTREYNHYSKLLEGNPLYNKNALKQTIKITDKQHMLKNRAVDRQMVNSKKFHDKFEGLIHHKEVNEVLYQESMKILEHRDGTDFEDMIAIDSRTGKIIESIMNSKVPGRIQITESQYKRLQNYDGKITLLHNHPNSSRPSFADIQKLKEPNIDSIVSVGHNGDVFRVYDMDEKFDVDKFYQKAYNEFKETYKDDILAEKYATNVLYDMGIFKCDSR